MPTTTALLALIPSVNALYDRFLIVITHFSSVLSHCLGGSSDSLLDAFLPILADPRTTAKIDFVKLDRRAVLRGSLVKLNEDVVDDTGEALALHANRWNGHHAGGTAGMSHGR